jgi:2-amino-4-hydroxy-6-hydroxymethyldihydropteridine diphosphokinase
MTSGRTNGQSKCLMPSSVNRVYIGLGSNLGDPRANLAEAVRRIEIGFNCRFTVSSLYESEPVGMIDQPWFLNQAGYFETDSKTPKPIKTLAILKAIEREMGREPGPRFGPRLIDLDLLFYRDWVFEGHELVIPHPRLTERSFVLMPLLELEQEIVHPVSGQLLKDILERESSRLTQCRRLP